jgi:hypothetical protein
VIERIGPGLIRVDHEGLPRGVWRARASRKICRCAVTRKLILPGDVAYGPVKTKRKGRDVRVLAEEADRIVGATAYLKGAPQCGPTRFSGSESRP